MDRYLMANAALSKFSRDYMELKKSLPIRPSEMGVINIITQTQGTYTPVQLSQMLGVSKPMIAAHLSALEKQGYVTRQRAKEDKRSYYVLPTQKAMELAQQARADMLLQLGRMEEALGQTRFDELIGLIEAANSVLEGCLKRERGEEDGSQR